MTFTGLSDSGENSLGQHDENLGAGRCRSHLPGFLFCKCPDCWGSAFLGGQAQGGGRGSWRGPLGLGGSSPLLSQAGYDPPPPPPRAPFQAPQVSLNHALFVLTLHAILWALDGGGGWGVGMEKVQAGLTCGSEVSGPVQTGPLSAWLFTLGEESPDVGSSPYQVGLPGSQLMFAF